MRPTRCVRSPRIQAVIPFASRCKEIWGVFLLLVAFAAISPAQTFLVLQNFNGSNGNDPEGSLVQGVDGALYGTTADGGDFNSGTVYKITPSGRLTTLHSFCAQSSCPDGRGIGAPLVVGSDGNLYGTTVSGGANGFGTVFKITPGGALTTIYSFCVQSNCTDGSLPEGGLVQATDGNFYGTTSAGGVSSFGTVFKITRAGGLTTLYSFCPMGFSCTDGDAPAAGLIQGKDGNFYGTTTDGGAHFQGGTVFKITPLGTLTTLYSFCALSNCADGFNPFKAPLVQGTDGNFYGTTSGGGTHSELGTIFKITPTGTLTTLYNFCALNNCTDGINPYFGVIQASDGNFYGTTFSGGSNALNGYGTIFKITPAGALTTLYTFCPQSGCSDSRTPYGGLVQATNGIFYGTACCGGTSDDGTVFSLSVGLGPFVTTQPGSGKVGTAVNIFGSNLTGATAVSF